MSCPACGRPVTDDAWICEGCDHILDPSVLGEGATPEADAFSEHSATVAWVVHPDLRTYDEVPDAAILGDVTVDGGAFSVVAGPGTGPDGHTSTFLYYSAAAPARVIGPDLVPERIAGRGFRGTPYEEFVFSCIDGRQSVRQIRKLSGLAVQEIVLTLLTLLDRGAIRIEGLGTREGDGTAPPDLAPVPKGFPEDEATATIDPESLGVRRFPPGAPTEIAPLPVSAPPGSTPEITPHLTHDRLGDSDAGPRRHETDTDSEPRLELPELDPAALVARDDPYAYAEDSLEALVEPLEGTDGQRRPSERGSQPGPEPSGDPKPTPESDPVAVVARIRPVRERNRRSAPDEGRRSRSRRVEPPSNELAPTAPSSPEPEGTEPADPVRAAKGRKLYDQALADQADGNLISARMNLKLALTFDPTNALYAQAFQAIANHPEARPRGSTEVQHRARELYDAATNAETRGDYDEAVRLMEEAIEISRQAAFFNRLGVLMAMRMREFERAQALIQTALELSPGHATYERNLQKILGMAAAQNLRPQEAPKRGGLLGLFRRKP